MSKDGELATRMAQADARKQTDGSYSNASKLAKVSKEALGSEASKMNSEAGQADQTIISTKQIFFYVLKRREILLRTIYMYLTTIKIGRCFPGVDEIFENTS